MLLRSLLASLSALIPGSLFAQRAQTEDKEPSTLIVFERRSEKVSQFWGRDMSVRAGVILPADFNEQEQLPVCYSIHGFGGSHRSAARHEARLVAGMKDGTHPRMLYVFLDAGCALGHHEFADSVNCGPWGTALVTEFIPALEAHFHAHGKPGGRFVTGHSSGGWSSLWLQVAHPDFFGGTWSTAPDPVDFHEFTGINIYDFDNAYVDPEGEAIQLVRRGGKFVISVQKFVEREVARRSYGGQFMSFNAVFSPRSDDGRPMNLFDLKTGKINSFVANAWRKYDIAHILESNWATLGPKLKGKLRVFVGTQDTFRLEEACRRLRTQMDRLGSDALVIFAEGRTHGDLYRPHDELWPDGLLRRIHTEMHATYKASLKKAK